MAETLLYITGSLLSSPLYYAAFLRKMFRRTANSFTAAATVIPPKLYPTMALAIAASDRIILYRIPAKMIGGQNKFSSPPTPFETRGRNVTVCPANTCCYHSGTLLLKFCLPTKL
jgi:hypothetical protein